MSAKNYAYEIPDTTDKCTRVSFAIRSARIVGKKGVDLNLVLEHNLGYASDGNLIDNDRYLGLSIIFSVDDINFEISSARKTRIFGFLN